MTIPDPATVFSSLNAARNVLKQFENTPLKAQLIDLQGMIIDAQAAAFEMQTQLQDAQRRIRQLEDQAQQKAQVTWDRDAYWIGPSREMSADGPFCIPCKDSKQHLVHMYKDGPDWARCPSCQHLAKVWPELSEPDDDRTSGGLTIVRM